MSQKTILKAYRTIDGFFQDSISQKSKSHWASSWFETLVRDYSLLLLPCGSLMLLKSILFVFVKLYGVDGRLLNFLTPSYHDSAMAVSALHVCIYFKGVGRGYTLIELCFCYFLIFPYWGDARYIKNLQRFIRVGWYIVHVHLSFVNLNLSWFKFRSFV